MKRKKVYNLFQINLMLFYWISILLVPVVIVFTYLFDLHLYTSINYIVLIATLVALLFFILGLTFLLITRDRYERILKPSYRHEFVVLNIVAALGILGIGIFYTYISESFFYFPHVVIPITIAFYTVILFVGNKFFNVNLFKN